jgi:peptide/nickel transport system permease protein
MGFLQLSDVIYLLMNLMLILFVYLAYRNPFNHRIVVKLFRQKMAAISLGIILFFWMISLLDSIRFSQLTVIDHIFYPLNEWMEYSYSRSFAINLMLPRTQYVHGRYLSVDSHLTYLAPIYQTTSMVYIWATQQVLMIIGVYFTSSYLIWYALRKKIQIKDNYFKNQLWMLFTFTSCCLFFFILIVLSRKVHVLGTGQIGQDILYQAIKSIRTGMLISLMTSMMMLPFAIVFGLVAGYFGGLIDLLVQFIYTTISSIPSVLFIGASLLSWQIYISTHHSQWTMNQIADSRLIMICILLGLSDWSSLCRYIRAEVLKLRALDYIQSAKLLGSSHFSILFKHLLPNTMHMIITTLVLNFSYLVLAESVLTYLGIGVSPLTISWGNMINAARLELARDPVIWWPLLAAFFFMFFLVLSCNLFADAIRKSLNPREELDS